ncbi:hypothetical protein [Shimia sp.]|uniref:hypothetical protein n=1 Tax=Shimia sp. TaxID=1954381 RepID=UPI003B8CAAC6
MHGWRARKQHSRRGELSFLKPDEVKDRRRYVAQVPRALAYNLGLFIVLFATAFWYFEPTTAPARQQTDTTPVSSHAPLMAAQSQVNSAFH